MDEEVVSELIQTDCNSKRIKQELTKILDSNSRNKMLSKYDELEQKLGGIGASKKTAKLIIENIR